MGKAVQTLSIAVAEVLTSPYCRCIDTAKLAFGKFTIVADLVWTLGQPEAETRRLAEALRKLLGTQPSKGTNTVLVSHTANLKEAVGVWPEPEGAMYIFQPREDGGVSYLGNIGPEEWTALTPTAE
jgi:phosphohistidine phosphatase SixA